MSEWLNPYVSLIPKERHLILVKYFWSMPNREVEYQHGESVDEEITNYVHAQHQDWTRRKRSEFRFSALENIALLLQTSPGTVLFRNYVYEKFDFLTIHGIIRDEAGLKKSLVEYFGSNKGVERHHSSPVFPICDLGNLDTEGIFGEETVKDCEQRGYKYVLGTNLMIRKISEEHDGPGAYERLPGVVKSREVEINQEWYQEYIKRYSDTP